MESSVAEWFLNTAAVAHATGNLQLLQDDRNLITYDLQSARRVTDAGGRGLYILGCGSVKTDRIEVPNVRYVQGLTVNVISVGQLAREHSLAVQFEPRYCYIMKSGGQIVGRGARSRDGRYVLEYLRVGLEDDASLSMPTGTSDDDDDDGSERQAGPDPDDICVGSDIAEAGPGATAPSVAEWVLDASGRTLYHETGNLLLLRDGRNLVTYDLQELADALPTGGDDRGLHILGCGSMKTDQIVVPNVRYVQGATENVIAVAQLSREHSLVVVFEPRYCYIRKTKPESGGQIVGRARLRTGRYVLEYLRVGLEDDASLKMPTGTGDDDDDDHDGSQPQAGPDPDSWFGLSPFDIPTVNSCCDHVCTARSTLLPGTPSKHFYMDSGAYCHSTGDPSVLQPYLPHLRINPPTSSLGGIVNGQSIAVEGCGYVNRDRVMKLDGVLYIPCSRANLVSIGQLAKQYGVRTVFDKDLFRVEKLQDGETMGQGHRENGGNRYVLDHFLPGGLFVHSQTNTLRSDMFGNVQPQQQPS